MPHESTGHNRKIAFNPMMTPAVKLISYHPNLPVVRQRDAFVRPFSATCQASGLVRSAGLQRIYGHVHRSCAPAGHGTDQCGVACGRLIDIYV
ncbi:MAG: hypothetical protein WAK95_00885 [Desulfobacterales bacterium]